MASTITDPNCQPHAILPPNVPSLKPRISLSQGSAEAAELTPRIVEDLLNYRIIDISAGDSHALALTHDSVVFAWGNNSVGQCGQGNIASPVLKPKRVSGLDGVPIHQICAGTSHSVAWTALPTDRKVGNHEIAS